MGGFSSKPCLITRGYSNSGLWQQFYHSYPYFQVKTSENKWQVMGWVHLLRGTFLGFPADLNWISPCPTCFIAFAAAGLGLWGIHVQTGPCSTYVWEDLISSGHTLNINLILEHGQSCQVPSIHPQCRRAWLRVPMQTKKEVPLQSRMMFSHVH